MAPYVGPNAFYRDFDNLSSFCDETRKVIPLFYLCFLLVMATPKIYSKEKKTWIVEVVFFKI